MIPAVPRRANDIADRRAAISLFEHDFKALGKYFFTKRWSRHASSGRFATQPW